MSELKATTVYDAYWKANSTGEGTGILVYLKYEADKVIEEKDKELRHQKIKRCEAMADYCSYKAWYYKYNGKEEKFYRWMKFRRIWVKLYNHFNEAK